MTVVVFFGLLGLNTRRPLGPAIEETAFAATSLAVGPCIALVVALIVAGVWS